MSQLLRCMLVVVGTLILCPSTCGHQTFIKMSTTFTSPEMREQDRPFVCYRIEVFCPRLQTHPETTDTPKLTPGSES